jgi:hypothetical protein
MVYGGLCAWFLGQADAAHERIAQGIAFARDANPIYLAAALAGESELCAWLKEPERAEAL